MDWWTKLEGEEHESCISGPSRDQVAGVLLERRALHQRHYPRVDARVRRSRQCCRGVERIRAQPVALRHYSHWPGGIGAVFVFLAGGGRE